MSHGFGPAAEELVVPRTRRKFDQKFSGEGQSLGSRQLCSRKLAVVARSAGAIRANFGRAATTTGLNNLGEVWPSVRRCVDVGIDSRSLGWAGRSASQR